MPTITANYHRLERSINRYIVDPDLKKSAYFIIHLYRNGEIDFEQTFKLLEDIHPNIHFELLSDTAPFPLATTGVFCKCTEDINGNLKVETNPVAGGGNMIRSEQLFECTVDRLPGYNNYYYTPTGKSVDCKYVAPSDIFLTCIQMLSGNLESCGD